MTLFRRNKSAHAIECILREEDVEGLIAIGAPPDEYADEARQIAEALEQLDSSNVGADRVLAIVAEVCSRMFGPFDSEEFQKRYPVYQRVARRVFGELQ